MNHLINPWRERQERVGDGAAARRDLLAKMLDEHGPMTLREMGRKSGIDITTIGVDLRRLAREGVVSKQGNTFQLADDL